MRLRIEAAFAAIAAAVLVLAAAVPSGAAALRLGPESKREIAALYDFVLRERAPGLVAPPIDFTSGDAVPVVCEPGAAPRTFAVLVGATDIGIPKFRLTGPANDVELLSTVFRDRGAVADRIRVLVGADATRAKLVETLGSVIGELGCEDRVILQFSGHAVSTKFLSRAVFQRAEQLVTLSDWNRFFVSDSVVDDGIESIRRVIVKASHRDQAKPEIAEAADQVARLQLAFDSDLAILLNDDSDLFHETIRGRDISDAMLAIRNKGAHAFTVIDTKGATLAAIEQRQREAGDLTDWSYEYRDERSDYWPVTPLVPNHGDYTIFYASGEDETTPEMPLPKGAPEDQQKMYGLFSHSLASGLLQNPFATPRTLAQTIDEAYRASNRMRPHPRVEASNPDLVVVAEQQPQRADPIRILSPAPTRGAAVMQKAELDIEGIVDWPAPVLGVHVDNQEAALDAQGRFRRTIRLKTGMNTISIIAVTADSRMLQKTLEFVFEGDRQALEGEGRRYAVVIGNQTYGPATGMPTLSTPFADADAVAALLKEKYGFVTEITVGNRTLPLVLKDATKRDIEIALFQLGKVAGAKDSVLVFYAGHGVFEPVTSIAYWVPSDAEAGFEPSYLSATDISAAIQRIQAGSVILISDSCYSGALLRGEAAQAETIEGDQRVQALLKLQSRRSRIVITSGNNEPVADLGGGGHSIFARAFLNGLEKMDHDAFSARELFDGYILQQVTANADQEPQYRPLEKVGHEGGDFVFVRKAAAGSEGASAD